MTNLTKGLSTTVHILSCTKEKSDLLLEESPLLLE